MTPHIALVGTLWCVVHASGRMVARCTSREAAEAACRLLAAGDVERVTGGGQ